MRRDLISIDGPTGSYYERRGKVQLRGGPGGGKGFDCEAARAEKKKDLTYVMRRHPLSCPLLPLFLQEAGSEGINSVRLTGGLNTDSSCSGLATHIIDSAPPARWFN